MDDKKGINFIFVIIAFILGTTLLRHFNFKTLSFKMPVLDTFFLIIFIVSIYLTIKDYNKPAKE